LINHYIPIEDRYLSTHQLYPRNYQNDSAGNKNQWTYYWPF